MLEEVLRNVCRLNPVQPVVVGVSGGADSLCLLDILHTAGYALVVAHFNHKLRPEADREAETVAQLAGSLGLPCVIREAEKEVWEQRAGHAIEETARRLRYRFLFETARRFQAQAVAVGHTADDQVETILMHLLRGAGLAGLRGMPYRTLLSTFDRNIPLVRPLLSLWREQTEAYCRERGLPVQWDASNADPTYARNRLRHQVIPALLSYQPNLKAILLRNARLLQEEAGLVQTLVEQAWRETVCEQKTGRVVFMRERLAALPIALRRHLMLRAAQELLGEWISFDFEALQRAAEFVEGERASRLDWGRSLWLHRSKEKVFLLLADSAHQTGDWPQVCESVLLREGQNDLGNGWVLTIERVVTLPVHWETDNWSAWLDADVALGRLTVRPRRPGDRFQPLGMDQGSLKLSDFFINAKLPQQARAHWPLVCLGEQIIWIPGFRVAHTVRVTEQTRLKS
ncbi:MAG: tRNA lysidine(34) synthetase TilS [Anaerolineales bacterium]|nr:tRNA lysidine(34) synthetase TilS [Anaerolineales bacterium]